MLDLVLRDARAVVAHGNHLSAVAAAPDGEHDLARLRRELDRVREQVERDLANGAFIAPQPWQAVGGDNEAEVDALGFRADVDHPPAVPGDIDEGNGLLMELVLARLDAAEVEQLVDEVEQVLPAAVNIAGIFLVLLDGVRAQEFGMEHF